MSNHEAISDRLYQDPELAQFYDLDNEWGIDLEYCLHLAAGVRSVLDLGCGTGQLAVRLAEGREVVGVDPAAAMLDIARRRTGGHRVTWVQSEAQSLELGRRFDLVVLTGHAFQVFLTDDEQRAALSTIAEHLTLRGRFIFDTRNPSAEEWRDWAPGNTWRIEHPSLGSVIAHNDAWHNETTGIVTYRTHYDIVESGRTLSADSKIRFTTRETLAAMLDEAGLVVDQWLGDWHGGASTPTSPEIIPIGRLAD